MRTIHRYQNKKYSIIMYIFENPYFLSLSEVCCDSLFIHMSTQRLQNCVKIISRRYRYEIDFFMFRLMFWTDIGTVPSVKRANMNGTAISVIIYKSIASPNGLAIDYQGMFLKLFQSVYFMFIYNEDLQIPL